MLTKEGCRSRLARLRTRLSESLGDDGYDAALIHQPQHLLYLANFYPCPNSLNYNSSSFLLIDKTGGTTLFVDNWLAPVDEAAVDEVVVIDWYTCIGDAKNRSAVVADRVADHLRREKIQTLAAELSHLPAQLTQSGMQLVEIEDQLRILRQVKDDDEIDAIRRGVRTAEAIHAASRDLLRPGMTEIEFYSQLVQRAIVAAETPFVMMCDLASGPRAAEGGGPPTLRCMNEGELVILDMFPLVEGYRGDITNTLVVGGRPQPDQLELFEVVHQGLKAAEGLLRPGTPAKDIYYAIDALFRESGGDRKLGHHAGHAIGLGDPEAPELVPETNAVLEEGMVVTLEPGLYGIPSGGIRIEHDYLITEDGYDRLSNHQLALC